MDLDFDSAIDWSVEFTIDPGETEITGGIGGSSGISVGTVTVKLERPFGFECKLDPDNEIDPWAHLSTLNGVPLTPDVPNTEG